MTNIIRMKMKYCENHCECDTETWSKQRLLENGADRLAQQEVVTNLQFVKKKKKEEEEEAQKQNICLAQYLFSTVKRNKIRSAYTL